MKWSNPVVLVVAVALNVLVLVAIPNFVVPPPLSNQREKAVINFIICLLPLLFSLFAVARLRGHPGAALRWLSILPAFAWLGYSIPILTKAFAK